MFLRIFLIIVCALTCACGESPDSLTPLEAVPHRLLLITNLGQEKLLQPSVEIDGNASASATYGSSGLTLTSSQDVSCAKAIATWKNPYTLPAKGKKFYVGVIYSLGSVQPSMTQSTITINGTAFDIANSDGKKAMQLFTGQPTASGQMESLEFLLFPCGADDGHGGVMKIYRIGIYQD